MRDLVQLDMYKTMHKFIQNSKSDICFCGRYSDIYNSNFSTKSSVKSFCVEKPLQMSNEEAITNFLKMDFFDASVRDKLFSRKVLYNKWFPHGNMLYLILMEKDKNMDGNYLDIPLLSYLHLL